MSLPASGIVTVRLASKDAQDIDALVEDGRFTNRSDFIRHAIRLALMQERAAEREERLAETTLLDGPGALPAPDAERAGGRRRSHKGVNQS